MDRIIIKDLEVFANHGVLDAENELGQKLEFLLKDEPGTVLPVLELIDSYHFNISYISSHENDTGYHQYTIDVAKYYELEE